MKWRAQDMENNSLSNKSKAIALFKWTNRKYLSVSIAYWILLFLAYPLAEIFIMITSISADGKYNYYVDRMQTYGVLIPSTLFAAIGNRIFNCNILNCIFVHA